MVPRRRCQRSGGSTRSLRLRSLPTRKAPAGAEARAQLSSPATRAGESAAAAAQRGRRRGHPPRGFGRPRRERRPTRSPVPATTRFFQL